MKKIYFLLAFALIFAGYSCETKNLGSITRNGASTTAIITVQHADGSPANGVDILIYSEVQKSFLNDPTIQQEHNLRQTAGRGTAEFDMSFLFARGQHGVATVSVAVFDQNGVEMDLKNNNDSRLSLGMEKQTEHFITVIP